MPEVNVPKMTHAPKPIGKELPPLRLAVYGEPGAGKTTLALSFPKPLVVSVDSGLEGGAVADVTDGEEWTPESWADLNALYFWLKDKVKTKGYQTIVIDSISSLAMLIRHEALSLPAVGRAAGQANVDLFPVTQPDYGKVWTAVESFLLKLTQLSQLTGVHIVLTANVREPDTDKGQTKRTFDLQPALESCVTQWANIYGELVADEVADPDDDEADPKKKRRIERRVLWTKVSDPRRKNKTRFAVLTPGVQNPTFEKIAGLIEAGTAPTTTTKSPGGRRGKAN